MAFSQWGADWNDASTILPDLADGSQLSAAGPNNDITNFNSPAIDAQMVKADGMTSQSAAAPMWATIDKELMQQAFIVPLAYISKVQTNGSNIIGGQIQSYGTPDPAIIAVVSKSK